MLLGFISVILLIKLYPMQYLSRECGVACTRLVFCYLRITCVSSQMLCKRTISYGASKDLILVPQYSWCVQKINLTEILEE